MSKVGFYRSFHTHPLNKLIHVFCIPTILVTIINFISKFDINTRWAMAPYSAYYYLYWGFKPGIIMQFYLESLNTISEKWRDFDKKWFKNSIIAFVFSWILQFIGHAIEGNRPALLTSLSQTIFQAPLLTLEYIYPNLLK